MCRRVRTGVSQNVRHQVYERDEYRCYRCGQKVDAGPRRKRKKWVHATLDHLIPRSRGGNNNPSNLKTCCKACNGKKGSKRLPDDTLTLLWTENLKKSTDLVGCFPYIDAATA